jgi:hypothetical protein
MGPQTCRVVRPLLLAGGLLLWNVGGSEAAPCAAGFLSGTDALNSDWSSAGALPADPASFPATADRESCQPVADHPAAAGRMAAGAARVQSRRVLPS